MDIAKQAVAVLINAERRLRQLVGASAEAGDYNAARQITDWARTVGVLVQQVQRDERGKAALANEAAGSSSRVASASAAVDSHSDDHLAGSERGASPASRPLKRLPSKGEYPRFLRRGDQLVKIGWSKKERGEYEHKAPRTVVEALTVAIAERSENRKLFTVEDLLPLKNPQDGSEIPGYQAYVALAWFKLAGLVTQHGRRGYSIRSATRLADAVAASWQQLPEVSD